MAVKLYDNILVQGIVESTAGTDPGSGYTSVRVDQAAVPTMGFDSAPRNIVLPSHSKLSPSLTGRRWEMTAAMEIVGGGYSGGITEPAMSWAWQAAALEKSDAYVLTMDNVVGTFEVGELVELTTGGDDIGYVAAVSSTELLLYDVTTATTVSDNDGMTGATSGATADVNGTPQDGLAYRPTSTRSEKKTATIHAYLDGIRKISTYSRAGLSLALGIGPKPSASFSFQGVYSTPTDTANPTASFQSVTPPDFHGGTVVFGSVTMTDIAFTSIGVDLGNVIAARQSAEASDAIIGFEHTDRDVTATFDPEVSAISDYNPYSLADAQTQQTLQYRWGSTQGNRHLVHMGGAVITSVGDTERNGIAVYNLGFNCEAVNSVNDSEFIYIVY